jgi:CxxC motif-containing protein
MREFCCITCPISCSLKAELRDGELFVTGNSCKRGADFALAELTCPMRSLSTTVRTSFPEAPVLPVRTDGEIPKDLIPQAMHALSKVVVRQRLMPGDTVLESLPGCSCGVVATSDALLTGS